MLQLPEVLPPANPVSPVHAAVDRCIAAYKQAYRAAGTLGVNQELRHTAACHAYRLALPLTETVDDILAFINCINHGIALGAFENHEPSQFLYSAQIALSVAKRKVGKE